MNLTVEKHYGLGLLPLGLLLNVQSHLKNLSEQLIEEKRQQQRAWDAVEEADKIRAERVTSYVKMKEEIGRGNRGQVTFFGYSYSKT